MSLFTELHSDRLSGSPLFSVYQYGTQSFLFLRHSPQMCVFLKWNQTAATFSCSSIFSGQPLNLVGIQRRIQPTHARAGAACHFL